MVNFYDEFNSVFWLSLGTMILGSFAVCLKYAYQSKCINLCFGLINIHRNIEAEVEIDEHKNNEEEEKV